MVTIIITVMIANIIPLKDRLDVHTLGGVMLLKTSQPSRTHMIRRVDYGQQRIKRNKKSSLKGDMLWKKITIRQSKMFVT